MSEILPWGLESRTAFVLVDCNSFYASCEALFEPRLWRQPLAVLYNNDGTVVALNAAAKAIGVSKFQPFFEIRHLMESAGLQVRSSNFELHGDVSRRICEVLEMFGDCERYSIDECFLELPEIGAGIY